MSVFLIDYENIGDRGFEGIEKLKESDSVYIFFSKNADKLTFYWHEKLTQAKAEINYEDTVVGTANALDFQLVSLLGYLISEKKGEEFYIVSKDKGFNCLPKFWKRYNKSVSCVLNLSGKNIKDLTLNLKKVLNEIADDKDIDVIVDFIEKYKTKQGLHGALGKKFQGKKAGDIYKKIKPYISDMKGN